MAKKAYIGENGVARKIKKGYVGVTEATNLVTNGSFESMDGWTTWGANAQDATQYLFGSKSIKLAGDELVNRAVATPIVGHKYYGREYIKTDGNTQPADCRFEIHGGDGEGLNWVFGWNRGNYPQWTMISEIHTVSVVNAESYVLRTFAIGATTGAIWIDGIMLIDLTATYGAGNEPSKEWCDANIPFFEGSTAVPNPFSSGKARKIKKAYIGIGGVARPCWSGGELAYYGTTTGLSRTRWSDQATVTIGNHALFGGGRRYSSASATSGSYVNTVNAYSDALVQSTPTSLATAKSGLGAATAGDKYAVFAGGNNGQLGSGLPTTTDAYDTSLTKTTPTAISQGRGGVGAASVGNYALFAGGKPKGSSGGKSTRVDAYDSTLTRTTTSLDTERDGLIGTHIDGYALFAASDVVIAFNASLVRTGPISFNTTHENGAATHVGSYAIFAGGDNVDACDSSLVFTTPGSLSVSRRLLAGTSLANYAIFAGGNSDNENEVDAFDESLTRSTPTPLSVGRYGLAAASVGNYALFSNGRGYASDYENVMDVYTVA